MGTLLRLSGALVFLATLFLPTLNGCGVRLNEAGLATEDGSAGALLLLAAAVGFGLLAFLGPAVSKPGRGADGLVALLAAAFAAGAVFFFNFARGKGAKILWAAHAQIVALAAILVGSILRLRSARKRRS